MNDDTQQGERRLGRSIEVLAFGDNADEIELAALDEARKFFGKDIRLEVIRDYRVYGSQPSTRTSRQPRRPCNDRCRHA